MKKLIAIDGNALLFRAYHATAFTNMMHTSTGVYTNALFSFINMMNKIQKDMDYDYLLVAFDADKTTFRHEKFKEYKGTRSKVPEELVMQFSLVREYLDLAKIPNYEVSGYEADDIIGTLAHQALTNDYHVTIISSDKDLLQLINPNVDVLLPVKGLSQTKLITENTMDQVWDITPIQVIDMKGLMGDPSDNIPGVKGIGEKTALKLIHKYGSVENIYNHIDELKGKLKENLVNEKEMAFKSKELATIITNIDLPFSVKELSVDSKEVNEALLKDFYHRYELNSFLDKMNNNIPKKKIEFEIVDKIETNLLLENSFVQLISLDENYHQGAILGLALVNEKGSYFIKTKDFINDETILTFLKNATKNTYDLKKNIILAQWHGFSIDNFSNDVMISNYIIDSNLSVEAHVITDSIFNQPTLSDKQLLKEDINKQIEDKMIQAICLNELVNINTKKLKDNEQEKLYQVELEVASILVQMELNGIYVSKEELLILEKEYQNKRDELEAQIINYAQEDFNVNSPKKLGEILFDKLNLRVVKKTKTGYSTDNEVLNELINDHPIIKLIIEYRTYNKLLSTYILPLPNYILSDGCIHTIYNQCLTATGRLSSKEPNLQNIATRSEEQRRIKKAFIAHDNYQLVSLDYSQIELRILASFAKDPVFIDAFKNNQDIHATTAAKSAKISEAEVTSEQRAAAKAINFGIIYGMSDYGLAKQINVTRQEAHQFIEDFYLNYPSIKAYLDSSVEFAQKHGYVKTILNRIRYIKEISSNNKNIQEMGKRIAMNTPLQGSAADIIKLAMINIQNNILQDNDDLRLLLQVHDELIFEIKKDKVEKYIPLLEQEMENAYQLNVKLSVNASVGKDWYSLK